MNTEIVVGLQKRSDIMPKKIFKNNALDVMRIAANPNLKTVEDEDLVSLAQEDLDLYRHECSWRCECGEYISYSDSLVQFKEDYIHELKCPNKLEDSVCRKNMVLEHPSGKIFTSMYFDELFSRFQDRIISEAMKWRDSEDPYEVYASLSGFFMKIIGKFARNKDFEKKSNSWFSSYFWRAIRNKSTDIRKTKNYSKRSPTVKCAICEKNVTNITAKHLMTEGHELVIETFFEELGRSLMEESGEIKFYNEDETLLTRAVYLGKEAYLGFPEQSRKDMINMESLRIYNELFPGSVTKNIIFSTNDLLSSGDSTEFEDICVDENSVFYSGNNDILGLEDSVLHIVQNIIKPNMFHFRAFFSKKTSMERRLEIAANIIRDKSSYNTLTDRELDSDYEGEARRGLTAAMFDFIKKDENLKDFLTPQRELVKEQTENGYGSYTERNLE